MLAKKTLVLTIAVMLSLVMVASAFGDTEKAKEFYNSGIQDKQAGKLDGAIMAFKAAIGEDAEYADAYVQLGAIYFGQKDYKGALEAFTSATEKAPKNAEAFANLGRVQMKLKKYEKATETLQTALTLAPADAAVQKELCKAHYYGGDYKKTIEAATKLHDAGGGDHISWFMVGKSYQKTDRPTKAIPAFEKSIGFKSGYYNAHSALGSIYLGQGKFKSAASAYKAALKAKPSAYLASYNYAVAVESGDSEDYATNIKVWESFIKMAKKNPKAKSRVAEAQQHVTELKDAQEKANLQ
jgi:tetratricopeptide (TPR) repeat protein